jgi:hypothetical protein
MTEILALEKTEGAGNAGRPMRPIAACAGVVVERTRVSQVTPESPGIPYAMVLTAYVVLSPAIGLSCHRRPCGKMVLQDPVGPATPPQRLDAGVEASGPHDLAVRCSIVRLSRADRSQVITPALRTACAQPTLPRPPHPVPNVRDDREPPLMGNKTAWDIEVIWVGRIRIYFCGGDWTGQIRLIWLRKLDFWRGGFCGAYKRSRRPCRSVSSPKLTMLTLPSGSRAVISNEPPNT